MGAWRPTWQIRTEMRTLVLYIYAACCDSFGIDRVSGCPGDSFLAPCQILLSCRRGTRDTFRPAPRSVPCRAPGTRFVGRLQLQLASVPACLHRVREGARPPARRRTQEGARSQTAKSHEPGLELDGLGRGVDALSAQGYRIALRLRLFIRRLFWNWRRSIHLDGTRDTYVIRDRGANLWTGYVIRTTPSLSSLLSTARRSNHKAWMVRL